MKITVFTGGQRRHISLINKMASLAEEVHAVMEVPLNKIDTSSTPLNNSKSLSEYFQQVSEAESTVFSQDSEVLHHVKKTIIETGLINSLVRNQIEVALKSDIYVVFGSSYIQGWLAEFLIQNRAINIHMGLSPFYRGAACNFWALYDFRPQFVGATIHLLDNGLDSGDIICHSVPQLDGINSFEFSMRSVKVAHDAIAHLITNEDISSILPTKQNKNQQIRYSRVSDFDPIVASEFLQRGHTMRDFQAMALDSHGPQLVNPIFE